MNLKSAILNYGYWMRFLPFSSTQFGVPRGYYRDVDSMLADPRSKTRTEPGYLVEQLTRHQKIQAFVDLQGVKHEAIEDQYPNFRLVDMDGARIYTMPISVITYNDKCILPFSFGMGESPANYDVFKRFRLGPTKNIEYPVLWLGGIKNYFHFLFDELPNLIHYNAVSEDEDIILLSANKNTRYFQELLPGWINKTIDPVEGVHWRVKRLRHYAKWYDPTKELVDVVRKFFKQVVADNYVRSGEQPSRTSSRIVIVRSGIRSFAMDDTDVSEMEKSGFELICLESLTIAEQVHLFENAEIIIGAHGAGLSNIIFSKEGTKVIEIMPEKFGELHKESFRRLAAFGGLDYTRYTAKYSSAGQLLLSWTELLERIEQYLNFRNSDQ